MTTNITFRVRGYQVIADAWAGTSAEFDLYTHGNDQFVAFYDADRNLTVGQRTLEEERWSFAHPPGGEQIAWDAHNYVTLTVDDAGIVHLSGNVHCDPLKYFRTQKPLDATTFERIDEMVGTEEDAVTYPEFFRGPSDELVFTYRDGQSGAGNWIYNVYERGEWRRLLDEPLTYGGDEMNAYPHGPIPGPDGYYHLCWVWRDHPGAESNHDLSYARSADLRDWETAGGDPCELPITIDSGDLVDPVPPEGGMINGNTKIGFDADDRVIVSYHKFDPCGSTQLYNARYEDGRWERYRTSDWEYRWAFGGGGSIPFEIRVDPVILEDGRLTQTYEHVEYGTGKWVLDEDTLSSIEEISPWHWYSESLTEVRSGHPDMQVNWIEDSGDPSTDVRYALRWEALEPNRDREREKIPPATALCLYEFA